MRQLGDAGDSERSAYGKYGTTGWKHMDTCLTACFLRMKCCGKFTLIELATEATQNGDNQTTYINYQMWYEPYEPTEREI